jgi:hypothetical protein
MQVKNINTMHLTAIFLSLLFSFFSFWMPFWTELLGPLVSPQKVGYSKKRVKMAIWVSPKSQAVFKDFSKYAGAMAVPCGLDERMPSLWINAKTAHDLNLEQLKFTLTIMT